MIGEKFERLTNCLLAKLKRFAQIKDCSRKLLRPIQYHNNMCRA